MERSTKQKAAYYADGTVFPYASAEKLANKPAAAVSSQTPTPPTNPNPGAKPGDTVKPEAGVAATIPGASAGMLDLDKTAAAAIAVRFASIRKGTGLRR